MNLLRNCFPFLRKSVSSECTVVSTTPQHNSCRALVLWTPPLLNLILYQSSGAQFRLIDIPNNITGLTLKLFFIENSIQRNHLVLYATTTKALLRKYMLIHSRSNNTLPEKCTLKVAGILNNDEFLLMCRPSRQRRCVRQHNDAMTNSVPTQADIAEATRNIMVITAQTPGPYYRDFQAFGLLDAFRSLLIRSARLAAFIIGGGAHAERLVEMLTKQLAYQAKIENNVIQSLVDLGFERSLVVEAVERNNLEYSEALRYLMDHESDVSLVSTGSNCSVVTSLVAPSRISMSELDKVRNIRSLLRIVEIHSRIKEPPQLHDVALLTDMGFAHHQVMFALRTMHNSVSGALEWLCGDREAAVQESKHGTPSDSAIVKYILSRPQFHLNLTSPTMFMGKHKTHASQNLRNLIAMKLAYNVAYLTLLDKTMLVKPLQLDDRVYKNIVFLVKAFNILKGNDRSNESLVYLLVNVFHEAAPFFE